MAIQCSYASIKKQLLVEFVQISTTTISTKLFLVYKLIIYLLCTIVQYRKIMIHVDTYIKSVLL